MAIFVQTFKSQGALFANRKLPPNMQAKPAGKQRIPFLHAKFAQKGVNKICLSKILKPAGSGRNFNLLEFGRLGY